METQLCECTYWARTADQFGLKHHPRCPQSPRFFRVEGNIVVEATAEEVKAANIHRNTIDTLKSLVYSIQQQIEKLQIECKHSVIVDNSQDVPYGGKVCVACSTVLQ